MRMRQETFKKSYYIPAFGKSIEIRRNQDIDEDGILGKELLAQYGEDCILEGETKTLMEKVASGDIGGSGTSLTTEQTAAIAKINGLESSASEIDSNIIYSSIADDAYSNLLLTNNGFRLNEAGALIRDAGWTTSDFIPIVRKTIAVGQGYSNSRVVVSLYDKDKNFISYYYGDTVSKINNIYYYKTIIVTPSNCAYIRVVSSPASSLDPLCKTYKMLNEAYDMESIFSRKTSTSMHIPISNEELTENATYRLNTDGTLLKDIGWDTTAFVKVDTKVFVRGYAFSTGRVVIATYDDSYNLINTYFGDKISLVSSSFYYRELELNTSDCSYVRVSGDISFGIPPYVGKYSNAETIINKNAKNNNSGEAPIFFKVSVNQSFQNNIDITQSLQDNETFLDVNCAMYLPSSYSAVGKPSKIAVVMHGAGGQVTETSASELLLWVSSLVSKGYVIFDVNGSNNNYISHSDHMGSSRALEAYNKAFQYIKDNYNVENMMYVLGNSMGGLCALNYANNYSHNVKVLCLSMPVTDLYNQAWLKPWYPTTKQQTAIEYNFDDKTGSTWEDDKVIGFNPIENYISSIPIKIWHGDADTVVLKSGSEALITRLKNNGVNAQLRIVSGMGHVSTPTEVQKEKVIWLNRF